MNSWFWYVFNFEKKKFNPKIHNYFIDSTGFKIFFLNKNSNFFN